MASKKNSNTVQLADNQSVDIVPVKHPGEDADAGWLKSQDEALIHYRLTGEAGLYVDPTRDQEPDIAPELGVAPEPDLGNPAPPQEGAPFTGVKLDQNLNPVLKSVERKEADNKDALEAYNEQLAAHEEAFKNQDNSVPVGATPVYVVEAPKTGDPVPPEPTDTVTPSAAQSADVAH